MRIVNPDRWQVGCLLRDVLRLESCGPGDRRWREAPEDTLARAGPAVFINPGDPPALLATGEQDCFVNLPNPDGTCTGNGVRMDATLAGSGVRAYQVVRNGTVIASVAGPPYTDAGLAPGTSYTYTLHAIDGAGNVSKPSLPVTLSTK
jgi:hypothetical protein